MKFEFRFPDIGEGIHEGTIMKWLVKVGDEIKEGDSLVEVETDKVTTEIPSPRTGKVLELRGEVSQVIHVGDVFVILDLSGEEVDQGGNLEVLDEIEEVVEEETAGVVGEVVASSRMIPPSNEGIASQVKKEVSKKVLATPVARQMAKDLGVDIQTVVGTGPNGRVMKEDIQKAKEVKSQSVVQPAVAISKPEPKKQAPVEFVAQEAEPYKRVPLTRIRKTIAEAMSRSRFTIPHTTAMDEVDVTKLDEFRKKYKDILKEEEVNLTYMPFIVKAVNVALKKFPEFNSQLDEEKDELIYKYFYHIGIATDTDRGLMVPVVRNADRMSIVEIAKAIEDVSSRAKENKIELSELKGSTFTITNYGSIGGYFGIPIINYPEAAILGLGRIVKKPIVTENDEIVIAKVLPLSLSYDHRTIDGASGARFLNLLKDLLSDPEMLLLKS